MPDLSKVLSAIDDIYDEFMNVLVIVFICFGFLLGWHIGPVFTLLGIVSVYAPLCALVAFGLKLLDDKLPDYDSFSQIISKTTLLVFLGIVISVIGALAQSAWVHRYTIIHTTPAHAWHLFVR